MDTSKARVGAGNIAIKLNETEYFLVPTFAAAQGISRISGGLRGAIEGVVKMDMDVIARVVQFGLGPKAVRDLGGANKLSELIWNSGLTDSSGEFAGKCVEYLGVLSNGGKPLAASSEDSDEGGDHPQ